jgi:ketosteroid isomerase-like protein
MSEENVATIARGYEIFDATGDFPVELMDPDFVWDMSKFGGWPERELYPGIEGAREFLAQWLEAWDDWKVELKMLLDAGEKVVAIVHQQGRSKATGLPVDMEFAQVWSLQQGRQIRMEMYADTDEALKAVGLSG